MPAKEKNAAECSDSALMLLFSEGEIEGFQQLYDRHKQSIFQFFYFGTNGDQELSSELFQDVWLTIVRGRRRFTTDICFIDWLRHVAWARLYDHLRMYPLTPQADVWPTEAETRSDASNIVSLPRRKPNKTPLPAVDGENTLLTTMQSLPDEQCEIVLLRYCFKMDINEIASFLDVAQTSVNLLHKEALASLRRTLPEAV
jgi:RNA polymerase sigma-70 factor (ECF subfamily)